MAFERAQRADGGRHAGGPGAAGLARGPRLDRPAPDESAREYRGARIERDAPRHVPCTSRIIRSTLIRMTKLVIATLAGLVAGLSASPEAPVAHSPHERVAVVVDASGPGAEAASPPPRATAARLGATLRAPARCTTSSPSRPCSQRRATPRSSATASRSTPRSTRCPTASATSAGARTRSPTRSPRPRSPSARGAVFCSRRRAERPSSSRKQTWLSKYGPSRKRQRTLGFSTPAERISRSPSRCART